MKLYLLSRTDNWSHDDFDSFVVAAESPDDAITIAPMGMPFEEKNASYSGWVDSTDLIECKEIGKAAKGIERGVIISSFNAG